MAASFDAATVPSANRWLSWPLPPRHQNRASRRCHSAQASFAHPLADSRDPGCHASEQTASSVGEGCVQHSEKTKNMNEDLTPILPGLETIVKPFKFAVSPYEYKVTALRECPTPEHLQLCDTPQKAADYWRLHVPTNPYFNPECECFCVLLLNTRRRVKGHHIVSVGTLDTILVHPREVFRLAIVTSAAAIVLAHNHPSGEAQPSEADIRVTRACYFAM